MAEAMRVKLAGGLSRVGSFQAENTLDSSGGEGDDDNIRTGGGAEFGHACMYCFPSSGTENRCRAF